MAITKVSAALVDLDGGVVINESSADADFRVESNGNANMLFVDGGNDRVGIGTGTPDSILDIEAVHSQLRLTDSDDSKFVLFSYSSGKLIVRNNSTDTTDNIYALQEDGNFGIGTHSPSEKLHIATSSGDCTLLIEAEENSSSREPHLQLKGTNTSSNPIIEFGDSAGFPGTIEYENSDNSMRFGTNAGEKMRIDSSGRLLINATSNLRTNEKLQVDGAEGVVARATANGGGCFVGLESSGNSAGGAFYGMTSGGTINFKVAVGGNVTNTNNSYGQISDIKLKENIVDATNKLDELKQIKIRNFNFIGDDTKQIGVVAQELETIFPALITDTEDVDADGNNAGTTTKEVKYSVLLPIAIKAIQELTTKLEAAEARITTLEG